jgi:hypothetical protein
MSLEEELKEGVEHSHRAGEKKIGLTMTIVAVFLAVATLLSHRTHTEEGLLQGKIVDQWNFYQAKHIRAHEYGAMAELATLISNPNAKDLALKDYKKSVDEECGTPANEGCGSPVKDSPFLLPILSPIPTSGAENKPDQSEASKKDAAKEHGAKAHGDTKEQPASKLNHKAGAVDVQEDAQKMERERDVLERQAALYDAAELCLEISVVLCSIALLTEMELFWKLSFISTIFGLVIGVWSMFGAH